MSDVLHVVHPRAPGLDVHKMPITATVRLCCEAGGEPVMHTGVFGALGEGARTAGALASRVRDRSLVFDLGFFRYQLFDCIDRNGGYFRSRLPAGAVACIVGVHRRWRGRAVELQRHRLDEVADSLKREILDVEVQVELRRPVCAARRRIDRRRLRLVGVRDAERGSYWFYLTNIAPQDLDANELA